MTNDVASWEILIANLQSYMIYGFAGLMLCYAKHFVKTYILHCLHNAFVTPSFSLSPILTYLRHSLLSCLYIFVFSWHSQFI